MADQSKFELKLGMATREAFGRTLVELGRENPDVVAVDADISKSTFTHLFAKEFPARFFSCGIAEANMVGIAAGLAAGGKIPFAASFASFIVNKGFEQMRVLLAYPHVNVKLVGSHSGISIGEDGPSQMAMEDLSLACSLPGFTVLAPADEVSMQALVRASAALNGPVYIRAGRPKVPVLYEPGRTFEIGKAVELTAGTDLTIIATGSLVVESLRAREHLESEGISARVLDMHTVKPLDRDAITRAAAETGAIVVAEEHLADGGLGVRVAQVIGETHPCPVEFVGIQNTYTESATPEQLLDKYGLVARDVIACAYRVLRRKR
jgi:transketolase